MTEVAPGVVSTPLTLLTTNAVAGFATSFPLSLSGTEVSTTPFLSVTPLTVDYGGIVVIENENVETVSSIITIANKGLESLTILGYGYTTDNLANAVFTNSTRIDNGPWDLGYGMFKSHCASCPAFMLRSYHRFHSSILTPRW